MKHGNNISNERKYFYELVIKDNGYKDIVQKTNYINWFPIFEKNDCKIVLGISESGNWVFQDERQFYVLSEKKMYLYCSKLLEIPYSKHLKHILISENLTS